ncbi:MAG: hypothetical protein RIK87_03460 [Fuerstiella sp.]
MNARVFLLILVTGLFMAAWNGDQAAMHAALAKQASPQATQVAASRPVAGHANTEPSHRLTAMLPASDNENTEAVPATRPHQIQLPDGISAGTYQAVSQSGASVRVTVSEHEAIGTVMRDFYVVDAAGGDRWYLVRLIR